MLTMMKNGAVWQIPVLPPRKHTVLAATTTALASKTLASSNRPPRKHTVYAATTTAPASNILASNNRHDVERMHEVLCCAGTTTMLRYYDYYKGTGFGKASKADIRNFRCPIKSLMQGDATHKKRTSGTKEVHAHAAHLDDEDVSCACCADQQPKRVKFAGPWPTLRYSHQS